MEKLTPKFVLALFGGGITIHVLMNGNERGVKGVELLAVFGTSMSKGFLDNGVPETINGRNILGQRLRPGVLRKSRYCS
jgi:hypothetical protein